jgi:hypothetical protein
MLTGLKDILRHLRNRRQARRAMRDPARNAYLAVAAASISDAIQCEKYGQPATGQWHRDQASLWLREANRAVGLSND